MRRQKFVVRITEQDVFDNRHLHNSHVEYIAKRFKDEHNVLVLEHGKLVCKMDPYGKCFIYEGTVGKGITDRQG